MVQVDPVTGQSWAIRREGTESWRCQVARLVKKATHGHREHGHWEWEDDLSDLVHHFLFCPNFQKMFEKL